MRFFILLALLAASINASAGSVTGKVSSIIVRSSDNLHYVYMSGKALNPPSCQAQNYWMIDEKTETGKNQLSMLIAARLADRAVTIIGKGTCKRWGDGEDIGEVNL